LSDIKTLCSVVNVKLENSLGERKNYSITSSNLRMMERNFAVWRKLKC